MNPISDETTKWQPHRYAQVLVVLVLITSLVTLRREIAALPQKIAVLWSEPDAPHHRPRDSDDAFLQQVDRLLPRHASVLLLTPGRDVRHREYTIFHRALYFLTPRPVWWLTPASPDATWESRWWISGPLTREEILRVAAEKGSTHLLAIDLAEPPPIGTRVADVPGATLLALAPADLAPNPPTELESGSSFWPVRVGMALLAIMMVGDVVLTALTRRGLEVTGIERAALDWTIGAGATSIAMFWLGAAGASLYRQIAIISFAALIGFVASRRLSVRRHRGAGARQSPSDDPQYRALTLVAVAVLCTCLLLVGVSAIGRPLTVWDSWVLWGMRARTMFVEGEISPVIYADPSRLVALPTYPLFLPSLEAWIYAWIGAADDRCAGIIIVLVYAALPAVAYAALRRRGSGRAFALLASAALAAVPLLVGTASGVLADLPVAVLTTVAAIYLVDWMEQRAAGQLVVAALAAGFLPWTKQEGSVVVAALSLATLITGRGRRTAWMGALALCGSALLLSGPWYVFVARHGLSGPQFDAVTVSHFVTNLDRLPSIVWHAFTTLISPAVGCVWPAAGLLALVCRPADAAARPSGLFLLAGCIYVTAMAGVYFFSAYAPYQQHIVSSFPRLVAQLTPLPLLWIAYHATPRP